MTEFYQYKNNIYIVLRRTKLKDITSRLWVDAYLYTDGTGQTYVREVRDFERKFKQVPNSKIYNLIKENNNENN